LTAPYPPPAATPAGNDKTTLWGVLGIVIGLLCCPIVGVVFGVLSINEAKKAGKPNTLGIVAIVASVIGVGIGIIVNLSLRK
jgi:amino acid transporter